MRNPIVVRARRTRRTPLAFSRLTVAAAGIGAGWTAWAQGAPLALTLSWQAPAECPNEAFVRGEVDRLLAEGPPPTAQIDAHAVVSATSDGRWRVHIATTRDGVAGERSIEAASCRTLAEATALILVLAIDPARAVAGPHEPFVGPAGGPPSPAGTPPGPAAPPAAPAGSASGPTAAPAAPSGSAASARMTAPPNHPPATTGAPVGGTIADAAGAPRSRPGPPVRAGAFAAVGGDIGTLPDLALGVALSAFVLVGPVRLEAYGEHWFGRSTEGQTLVGQTTASYGGTISLSSAGAGACIAFSRGRVDVAPCLAVELGDLHGVGAPSIDNPASTDGWWVAVVGGVHATMRLVGPLRVGLRIEGVVPLIRDRFVARINGQPSAVFQLAPIAGRAFLGPELRF